MMAMFLGQWTLRGYGVWACDKVDDAAKFKKGRKLPVAAPNVRSLDPSIF